jgi:hypothetical protein
MAVPTFWAAAVTLPRDLVGVVGQELLGLAGDLLTLAPNASPGSWCCAR